MFYQAQLRLHNILVHESFTKLKGINKILLTVKYLFDFFFCFIFLKKSTCNSQVKDEVGLVWSALHSKVLGKYVNDLSLYIINTPLSKADLKKVIDKLNLKKIIINTFQSRKFTDDIFLSFILSFEKEFFLALLLKYEVKKIYMAGHYDRYSYTISYLAKKMNIILEVYQHGSIASFDGFPKFFASKIFLQYAISKEAFSKFYDCRCYELIEPFDVDRITNAKAINDKIYKILYIGQDIKPIYNELIIKNIVKSLENINIEYKIYHLKHPRDKYTYSDLSNYREVDFAPSNPDVVFSRYSTLAYTYHVCLYKVYFITLDNINVDFMNDRTLKKNTLKQIYTLEYLDGNI